jgi:hypothetical protein
MCNLFEKATEASLYCFCAFFISLSRRCLCSIVQPRQSSRPLHWGGPFFSHLGAHKHYLHASWRANSHPFPACNTTSGAHHISSFDTAASVVTSLTNGSADTANTGANAGSGLLCAVASLFLVAPPLCRDILLRVCVPPIDCTSLAAFYRREWA